MRPVTTPARLVAGVAAATLVGAALAGCGGGDGGAEAARADLVGSLGFLRSDLGLSDDEVGCTARTIQEEVDDDVDLDALADDIRRVDEGDLGLTDLPGGTSEVLTAAIASCTRAS